MAPNTGYYLQRGALQIRLVNTGLRPVLTVTHNLSHQGPAALDKSFLKLLRSLRSCAARGYMLYDMSPMRGAQGSYCSTHQGPGGPCINGYLLGPEALIKVTYIGPWAQYKG